MMHKTMPPASFTGWAFVLLAALALAYFSQQFFGAELIFSFIASATAILFLWAGYSKIISSKAKLPFDEVLWKDSFSYLPFLLLFFIALKGLAATISGGSWEFDAAALSINLLGKVLLVTSITLFIGIKVFTLPENIKTNFLPKLSPGKVLLAMAALYFITFIAMTFIRYLAFKTPSPDLWIFNQAMWNTLHGNFMVTTRTLELGNQVLLGDHFFFILILLLPLYSLVQHPLTLYFVETFFIALAAIPAYKIAKMKFGDKLSTLVFPLAFLLYPALHFLNLAEFQPLAFAIPFYLFAFYYLLKNENKKFFLFLLLAFSVRETAALIGFFFGIYIAAFRKRYKLGAAVSAVSLIWFFSAVLFIIPSLGTSYQYIGGTQNAFPNFGGTSEEVISNMMDPVKVFREATTIKDLGYLALLFAPVAFLALFSAAFAIPLPIFALNLLSGLTQHGNIYFQYNAEIIPFIFIALVLGAANARKLLGRIFPKNKRAEQAILASLFCASLLSAVFFGPTPLSLLDPAPNLAGFSLGEYALTEHHAILREAISMIPENAAVSTDNMLTAQLSCREEVYYFPYNLDRVDYALVDTSVTGHASAGPAKEDLAELLENPDFEKLMDRDGVILFKRIR